MLCEQCRQREATTHIKRVVNGEAEEFHLCTQCAQDTGLNNAFAMPGFGFGLGDLFSGFLGSSLSGMTQSLPSPVRCEFCGSSLNEIIQSSRVGCARCYETFYEQLQPTLQRIHGALEHTGKAPEADPVAARRREKEQEINRLRSEIAAAVQAEDYERAARLRDEIRGIEEGGEDNA